MVIFLSSCVLPALVSPNVRESILQLLNMSCLIFRAVFWGWLVFNLVSPFMMMNHEAPDDYVACPKLPRCHGPFLTWIQCLTLTLYLSSSYLWCIDVLSPRYGPSGVPWPHICSERVRDYLYQPEEIVSPSWFGLSSHFYLLTFKILVSFFFFPSHSHHHAPK